ncbi:sigma-54 interaction domain-containing protein [Pseudomonas panipatensis]|uniref:sigma-54 interaction domain-containing protein n=1 Tax=Pseudomonas panipatensis TaxID=428992 RepID=UPI0035B09B3E
MTLVTLPPSPALANSIRATALVFEDPRSRALRAHLEQIAGSEASVLIVGETGAGKELVARQIHALSPRRDGPFVAVNCGAFASHLVEAELFGHVRGAFTGAIQDKAGWFETANGGTLFLDEIGDLPLQMQVKLLRVLQQREVVRLGGRRTIPIDVRVVAATNVDLEKAISAGNFRDDLYYRVAVVSLRIPPLRERRGDILPLARHFAALYSRKLGVETVTLDDQAEKKLLHYAWPGNIRELENSIHRAVLVCGGKQIKASDLFPANNAAQARGDSESFVSLDEQLEQAYYRLFDEGGEDLKKWVEELLLREAYRYCQRNQVHTAELLGVSRNIVRARLISSGELAIVRRATLSLVRCGRVVGVSR